MIEQLLAAAGITIFAFAILFAGVGLGMASTPRFEDLGLRTFCLASSVALIGASMAALNGGFLVLGFAALMMFIGSFADRAAIKARDYAEMAAQLDEEQAAAEPEAA